MALTTFSHYGFNDFVILCGYKSEMIKRYFVDYYLNNSDITVDLVNNSVEVHSNSVEPWRVTTFYTGRNTMTGGRIRRIKDFIGDEPFMLTYGDGVSNVNIKELVAAHKASGKLATLTSVQPTGRFGAVEIAEEGTISSFEEKPHGDGAWINGGFFVLEPGIFDYIADDDSVTWEQAPLRNLAKDGQLGAYKHKGFWRPMDTLKDRNDLNNMWESESAPWKLWE